ncbi:hypothetical protein NECAME_12917 [Necator americanus]|uniref:Uncharacterized protein n=1 Tax=Necator americanus TaxID=51031 RepID=W2SZW4_NECAM|nr:hypothetical protein NECAME_12917 [Necator americanus]ETN74556.1 hypothetical protein NECAME_12917 [Necator americanus]
MFDTWMIEPELVDIEAVTTFAKVWICICMDRSNLTETMSRSITANGLDQYSEVPIKIYLRNEKKSEYREQIARSKTFKCWFKVVQRGLIAVEKV